MNDPYDLQRFVDAQAPMFKKVCEELRAGRKESHWMWFIFPQLRGLGQSWMANHYGIASLDEARAYLAHPVLGPRLKECTRLVCQVEGSLIGQIFGDPDDLKFRSSMTLFAEAAKDEPLFATALEKYFRRRPDHLTLDRLKKSQP